MQQALKIIEGTIANVPPQSGRKHPHQEYIQIDTRNILFICGGAFEGLDEIVAKRIGKQVPIGFGSSAEDAKVAIENPLQFLTHDDLLKYGLIPEFVGRLPVSVSLDTLTRPDLIRILTEPRNAVVKQYEKFFALDNVELVFTDDALEATAKQAGAQDGRPRSAHHDRGSSARRDVRDPLAGKCPQMRGRRQRHQQPHAAAADERERAGDPLRRNGVISVPRGTIETEVGQQLRPTLLYASSEPTEERWLVDRTGRVLRQRRAARSCPDSASFRAARDLDPCGGTWMRFVNRFFAGVLIVPALTLTPAMAQEGRLGQSLFRRPDDGLVRAGQALLSGGYELQGAEPPAPRPPPTGGTASAAGGVRGLLAADGPTRPKWRCGPVWLDRGAEHHRWRGRTTHCLRRLHRGTICRTARGVDAASATDLPEPKTGASHRPR